MSARPTLLDIPLLEERYGSSLVGSVALHVFGVALVVFLPLILPRRAVVMIGTGPGGGSEGRTYTVGVADDLAGGAGMYKPSLVPKPPALTSETKVPEEVKEKAIPLPQTIEPKKPRVSPEEKAARDARPPAKTANVIPTRPEPGAGGQGGVSGGSGGGRGGGTGVSIGSGSGGFGDSYYARAVESRVSSNWIRPIDAGVRFEVVYSFVIAPSGAIAEIKRERSSGNDLLDLAAERAIRASNPLPKPPPEFGGRPILFMAQFVHPPTP
jgi:TonB family protein